MEKSGEIFSLFLNGYITLSTHIKYMLYTCFIMYSFRLIEPYSLESRKVTYRYRKDALNFISLVFFAIPKVSNNIFLELLATWRRLWSFTSNSVGSGIKVFAQ